MTARGTRPLRTAVATVGGAVLGGAILGPLTGQVVQGLGEGEAAAWAGLAAAILGTAVGAVLGAGVALAVAFRDEPPAARRTTVLATVLGAPLLVALLAATAGRLDQDWNLPPLWLALGLVLAAFTGRWLAGRAPRGDGQSR